MNYCVKMNLNSVESVKEFYNASNRLIGDVFIQSGRYIIDGKSVMGIFSLDLSKPVHVYFEIEPSKEDFEIFRQWIIE